MGIVVLSSFFLCQCQMTKTGGQAMRCLCSPERIWWRYINCITMHLTASFIISAVSELFLPGDTYSVKKDRAGSSSPTAATNAVGVDAVSVHVAAARRGTRTPCSVCCDSTCASDHSYRHQSLTSDVCCCTSWHSSLILMIPLPPALTLPPVQLLLSNWHWLYVVTLQEAVNYQTAVRPTNYAKLARCLEWWRAGTASCFPPIPQPSWGGSQAFNPNLWPPASITVNNSAPSGWINCNKVPAYSLHRCQHITAWKYLDFFTKRHSLEKTFDYIWKPSEQNNNIICRFFSFQQ